MVDNKLFIEAQLESLIYSFCWLSRKRCEVVNGVLADDTSNCHSPLLCRMSELSGAPLQAIGNLWMPGGRKCERLCEPTGRHRVRKSGRPAIVGFNVTPGDMQVVSKIDVRLLSWAIQTELGASGERDPAAESLATGGLKPSRPGRVVIAVWGRSLGLGEFRPSVTFEVLRELACSIASLSVLQNREALSDASLTSSHSWKI